jgi:hypothetical protein
MRKDTVLFQLKRAIIESGYKQSFLARQVGIDENKLTKAITGRCQLADGEKQKLADVLSKRVDELVPYTDADTTFAKRQNAMVLSKQIQAKQGASMVWCEETK